MRRATRSQRSRIRLGAILLTMSLPAPWLGSAQIPSGATGINRNIVVYQGRAWLKARFVMPCEAETGVAEDAFVSQKRAA
jgi:hypothetical protein